MNSRHIDSRTIAMSAALIAAALISIFWLSGVFSSASFHAGSISFLDNKKLTVAGMVATVSAASTAIAAVPGDATTPIAQQLASTTSWLLLVTVVIIVEKYLLTIIGYLSFTYIIPAACALGLIYLYTKKNFLRALAIKLAIFGLALFAIVPTSVQITRIIEKTHQDTIDQSMEAVKQETADTEENKDFWSSITSAVESVSQDVVNTLKTEVSSFIDAIAVLVVTSCIIPLLVLMAFSWLIKMVFGIRIDPPKSLMSPLDHARALKPGNE